MWSEVEQKLINLSEQIKDNQIIDFEWNFDKGLRNISDVSLQLACEMLIKGKFSLKERDGKLVISNKITNLCTYDLTTFSALKSILESDELIIQNINNFSISKNRSIDYICPNCKFQKCPKYLSGYIYYLMCNKQLIDKLKDRKEYRSNHIVNDIYTYTWNFGNCLRIIPDDVFEFCYTVVKNNLVYVNRNLSQDGKIIIYSALSCFDYKNLFGDVNKLNDININFDKWVKFKKDPSKKVDLCANYSCGLNGCLYIVSAVIHYLISSGQENILIEERDYYHEHKLEMDEILQQKVNKKLNDIKDNINSSLDVLNNYKDKITNFDELIATLKNKNQKSFHCIIEGEDEKEREIIVDSIVNFINKSRNIVGEELFRYSLQNLTALQLFSSENYVDKKKVAYECIKKNKLKENKIYVIDGIGDFVSDFKIFKSTKIESLHGELRNKQYNYIIKLLTEISRSNYIIIEGTTEEIESFIELEPKLQYVYQNKRFKVPDFSLEDSFNLYTRELENNLFNKYKENPELFRKQFLEYVSLNKNFIPFSNRELASYLSSYSNTMGEIVFPDNIYKRESTEEALKNIIGLDSVKQKVKDFEKYMLFKIKAEAEGLKLASSNMHMIFTGNPGTGKTTIARIMAKMLFDMGVIKENKLIEVERKDLIGQYLGQTAPKTYEVIKKAMGGVLFIDEAYSLASDNKGDYGSEAIATLIKSMEDHKNELVVIFAGYKNEMDKFMDINPGITSRIGYTFDFEDYNSEELVQIFHKKIQNMGFECLDECNEQLIKLCTYFSRRKDFGNGRFVDKLIQEVMLKHAINEYDNIKYITRSDIPLISELNNATNNNQSTDELLEKIIGLDKLKLKIKEFEEYVKFIKNAEKHGIKIPNQNMHMIFTGNPGTGKTTIARIMAQILFNTGIIQENKLIEVERKDLIGQYTGQTAPKTHEVIEKAMGGVLFIDEAYSLVTEGKNDFGSEAISTLIKAMEDHKDDLIVIFAGYKKEMGQFLDNNSGIASRIGYTFEFEDYDKFQLAEIFYKKLESSKLKINEEAKPNVLKLMGYFCNVENIGNGRFADRVYKETILKHAKNNPEKLDVISVDDIPTIKEITNTLYDGQNMINPDIIDAKSLRKTAIHEIGHAFVRCVLYNEPGILKITINAEGNGNLGYVMYKDNTTYVQTKSNLLDRIKVSMAGMAAEESFIGEFANGNTSDLEKATRIAKNMVTRYGMSSLGYGQIKMNGGSFDIKIQEEINRILDECYKETKKILLENKEKILRLVEFLLDNKEITEEDFFRILNSGETFADKLEFL